MKDGFDEEGDDLQKSGQDPFDDLKWKTVKIDDAMRGEAGLMCVEELDPAEIAHLLPKPALGQEKNEQKKGTNKRKRVKARSHLADQNPGQKQAVTVTEQKEGEETTQGKRKRKRKKTARKQQKKESGTAETSDAKEAETAVEEASANETTETSEADTAAQEQGRAKKNKKNKKETNKKKPDVKKEEGSNTNRSNAKTQRQREKEKKEKEYVPAIVPTASVEDWKRKWGRLKSWAQFNLHPTLMQGIKEYKFFSPTPIQEKTLYAALREDKDVVGVAETGSGKTLAYGLPILHKLTKKREQEERAGAEKDRRLKALILAPTRELAVQVSDQLKLIAKHTPVKIVPVIGGLSQQKQVRLLTKKPEIVVATPGRLWEIINGGDPFLGDLMGLEFLVIDEADRMVETGHFHELKSILTLIQHPANRELIVLPATPDLRRVLPPTAGEIENGEELEGDGGDDDESEDGDGEGMNEEEQEEKNEEEDEDDNVAGEGEEGGDEDEEETEAAVEVKEEKDDEDDEQTVPAGSFDEDENGVINVKDEEDDEVIEEEEEEKEDEDDDATIKEEGGEEKEEKKEFKRQTFVFSATLTIAAQGRTKLGSSASKNYKTGMNALAQVSKLVGFERPRKVVDLTTKKVVVSTLEEAVIQCLNEEKDYYLYYFTQKHKGRTLVFCNSISCIRRLIPVLAILNVPAWGLHASMQQRQRLKNLERFRNSPESILIATDVAARGLDIPLVDHVIHYQLPRTAELYVHRSGRTARAAASGLSVMLVGPDDMKTYRQICSVLRQGREVEPFAIDRGLLPGVAKRVNVARKLDAAMHDVRKKKTKKDWFTQAAEEMDIDLDDDILSSEDEDTKDESLKKQREINALKQQLAGLMKQALLPKGGFTTFFTRSLFYDPNKLSEEINKAALSAVPTGGSKAKKAAKARRKGRK